MRGRLHRRGPVGRAGKNIRQTPRRGHGQPAGHVRIAKVGIHHQHVAFQALGQQRRQPGQRHRLALAIRRTGEQQHLRTTLGQLAENLLGRRGVRIGGDRLDHRQFGIRFIGIDSGSTISSVADCGSASACLASNELGLDFRGGNAGSASSSTELRFGIVSKPASETKAWS